MSWLDGVQQKESILAVFTEKAPSIASVRVHEITFHRDGPTIQLRLDLRDFPDPAPEKWAQAGHNTVQIKLSLDVVRQVTLDGWSLDNVGPMDIAPLEPSGFSVKFTSGAHTFRAVCDFISVTGISAHHSPK